MPQRRKEQIIQQVSTDFCAVNYRSDRITEICFIEEYHLEPEQIDEIQVSMDQIKIEREANE